MQCGLPTSLMHKRFQNKILTEVPILSLKTRSSSTRLWITSFTDWLMTPFFGPIFSRSFSFRHVPSIQLLALVREIVYSFMFTDDLRCQPRQNRSRSMFFFQRTVIFSAKNFWSNVFIFLHLVLSYLVEALAVVENFKHLVPFLLQRETPFLRLSTSHKSP